MELLQIFTLSKHNFRNVDFFKWTTPVNVEEHFQISERIAIILPLFKSFQNYTLSSWW